MKKKKAKNPLIKFKFEWKETRTTKIIIKANNEFEAKRILKMKMMKSLFRCHNRWKKESEFKILDQEIFVTSVCSKCGTEIVSKFFLNEFNDYKVGTVKCPKCQEPVYPCDDCSSHLKCNDCPYRKDKYNYKGIIFVDGLKFNQRKAKYGR